VSPTDAAVAIPHSPFVPYDPEVMLYDAILRPFLIPFEYTLPRNQDIELPSRPTGGAA